MDGLTTCRHRLLHWSPERRPAKARETAAQSDPYCSTLRVLGKRHNPSGTTSPYVASNEHSFRESVFTRAVSLQTMTQHREPRVGNGSTRTLHEVQNFRGSLASTIVQSATHCRYVLHRSAYDRLGRQRDKPLWCPLYCRTVSPEAISHSRAV